MTNTFGQIHMYRGVSVTAAMILNEILGLSFIFSILPLRLALRPDNTSTYVLWSNCAGWTLHAV